MSEEIKLGIEQANIAFLARDFEHAEKILLDVAVKHHDLDNEDYYNLYSFLGKVYIRAGKFNDALETWQKLNKRIPYNTDILNNLGVVYRHLKEYSKSAEVLLQAKRLGKNINTTLYNLGSTYKESGYYEHAADCFSEVIQNKKDDVLAYNHLGTVQSLRGEYALAIEAYRSGLQIDPNHPFLNYNLANLFKSNGNLEEALVFYKAALKVKPNWADALKSIGEIHLAQNRLNKATVAYQDLVEVEGYSERVCVDLAKLYLKQGNEQEAENTYKKAIEQNNKLIPAVTEFSKYLLERNRSSEALEILRNAVNDGVKDFNVLILYANTCLNLQDFPCAKKIIHELKKQNPDSIAVWKIQGKLFSLLGETEKAEKIFRYILSKEPTEITVRVELAEQYMKALKYANARDELIKYLNEKPNDIRARINLGKSLENLSQIDLARNQYNQVLKIDDKNTDALSAISSLLQKEGDFSKAVMFADEVINVQTTRGTDDDLKKLSESLSLYEQAANKFSENSEITKNLDMLKTPAVSETPDLGTQEPKAPVVEEDESLSLLDMEEFDESPDLDMPFDDLMELGDEEDPWDIVQEPDIEELVNFDTPIDATPTYNNEDGNEYLPSTNPKSGRGNFSDEEFSLPEVPSDDTPKEALGETKIDDAFPDYFETDEPAFTENPIPQNMSANDEIPSLSEEKEPSFAQLEQPPIENKPAPEFVPPIENKPEPKLEQPGVTTTEEEEFKKYNDLLEKLYDKINQQPPQNPVKSVPEKVPESISAPPDMDELEDNDTSSAFDDYQIPQANLLDTPDDEMPEIELLNDINLSSKMSGSTLNDLNKMKKLPVGNIKPSPGFEKSLAKIPTDQLLKLFEHLRDLMLCLPEHESKEFILSNERVKMEYIIDKLSGSMGLKKRAVFMNLKKTLETNSNSMITKNLSVKDLLQHLKKVSQNLPDYGFANNCINNLNGIIKKLK
ncbi:MAG: hypothetical protein CR988_05260 [Treponema sp.]|nr:MAG: hypothetical protein CR988_05260 [Treponema sp.]